MCGTFQMIKKGDVGKRFGFSNQTEIPFSYNIQPEDPALIVTRNSPNKGEVRAFVIKAPWDEKRLLINAQVATVAVLKTFCKLFAESRCLIAFTSYVGWEKLPDKSKQPWAFRACLQTRIGWRKDGAFARAAHDAPCRRPVKSAPKVGQELGHSIGASVCRHALV